LKNSSRYAFLFSLDIKDYKGWAFGLKKAGYATNPRYPYILINSIEKYNLHQYTLQGLSGNDVFDEGKYKDEKENENTITIMPVKMDDVSPGSPVSAVKGHKTVYNGLKAVFAPRETSLLAIATENNIALSKLLEYNDLITDGLLEKDQWVFLEKKLKHGNTDIYVTKGEESLYDVSQISAVQLESLEEYNQMKSEMPLAEGTRIALRAGVTVAGIKDTREARAAKKIHQVLPKEGLYAISKKYNVSVKEIKEWNNLTSDVLRVGQQLIILK
jgi:LysM repeat protein